MPSITASEFFTDAGRSEKSGSRLGTPSLPRSQSEPQLPAPLPRLLGTPCSTPHARSEAGTKSVTHSPRSGKGTKSPRSAIGTKSPCSAKSERPFTPSLKKALTALVSKQRSKSVTSPSTSPSHKKSETPQAHESGGPSQRSSVRQDKGEKPQGHESERRSLTHIGSKPLPERRADDALVGAGAEKKNADKSGASADKKSRSKEDAKFPEKRGGSGSSAPGRARSHSSLPDGEFALALIKRPSSAVTNSSIRDQDSARRSDAPSFSNHSRHATKDYSRRDSKLTFQSTSRSQRSGKTSDRQTSPSLAMTGSMIADEECLSVSTAPPDGLTLRLTGDREARRKLFRAGRSESMPAPAPGSTSSKLAIAGGNVAKGPLGGFSKQDQVTSRDGPDADAPWRHMGDGTIQGPSQRPGFLEVKFEAEHGSETFDIKASNLGSAYTPRDDFDPDPMRGLFEGDPVSYQGNGKGVVVERGEVPGTVMVKFGGVGVRCVNRKDLRKMMPPYLGEPTTQEEAEEQARAAQAWALEWAGVQKSNGDYVRRDAATRKPPNGLKKNQFVEAKSDPWKMMELGLIRDFSDDLQTAVVQYNIMGEEWRIRCEDLIPVGKDPGFCKFKLQQRDDLKNWPMPPPKTVLAS